MEIVSEEFWQGKKVFITGHTGFKGAWLLIWLLKKNAIICGYSLKEDNNSLFKSLIKSNPQLISKFNNNYQDINNFQSIRQAIKIFQPDVIFHLAAQAIVYRGYEDPISTWQTNVMGSLNLLECLKSLGKRCAVIMVTTDKVYKNKEWLYGYREVDQLGGIDPYSASKSAAEIAIASWRFSFSASEGNDLRIGSVRSGNVIGGGDWATNRIIPDSMRALLNNQKVIVRNPLSRRPWLHVLEPLHGYMLLAEKLYLSEKGSKFESEFNFGPKLENNKTVEELVRQVFAYFPGEYEISKDLNNNYESKVLHLNTDKSSDMLKWSPILDFPETIKMTIQWYIKNMDEKIKESPFKLCITDINNYEKLLAKISR